MGNKISVSTYLSANKYTFYPVKIDRSTLFPSRINKKANQTLLLIIINNPDKKENYRKM